MAPAPVFGGCIIFKGILNSVYCANAQTYIRLGNGSETVMEGEMPAVLVS